MGKSLKERYQYYYRRRYQKYIESQALDEAIIGGTLRGKEALYFAERYKNFERVFKEGFWKSIYRNGKKVKSEKITGEEAVNYLIIRFKKESSKVYLKNNFIENYLAVLEENGLDEERLEKLRKLFKRTPADKLTILIRKGILPSFKFLYSGEDLEKIVAKIEEALTAGISSLEYLEIKNRQEKLIPFVRARNKILRG